MASELNSQSSPPNVEIDGRHIGSDYAPFIIAELSANHGGSFDRAVRIIEGAAEAGADAIKFQAYTADSLTIDSGRDDFLVKGDTLWDGRRLHDLYTEAATPYDWFPELFSLCREKSVIPFASAFDKTSVEFLQSLDAPAYKVASFEAIDHGLISLCAQTGKPVIISTGLCTHQEITDAVEATRTAGGENIVLLHCNSAYPATGDEANLLTVPSLARDFGIPIGYSDHTLGTVSSVAACALGASVIEKHVIDSPEPPTADSAFSLTPDILRRLVEECRAAWTARGGVHDGPTETEKKSLPFRRSLYVVDDVDEGELITESNVRSIRPGHGLAPKHLNDVIGRTTTRPLEKGEALAWSMLSGPAPDDA